MLHGVWAAGTAIAMMVLPVGVSLSDSSAPLPAISTSSGVAVAAGTATSASGAVLPGVAVDLYAWPSDAVLSAMKPGELVATTLLATATTTEAGRYTLRVPAATLKAAAVASGYANLEVSSAAGIWFLAYPAGPLPARPSPPVTVNLDSKPKWVCGYDAAGQPYGLSKFALVRHRPPTWAVVGQGYIVQQAETAGDHVNFDYTQGSSHAQASALGVGLSGYGISAGYASDGTHPSTARRSQSWPNERRSTFFTTQFKVEQFRAECYGPPFVKVPQQHQHSTCPRKYEDSYVHKCLWLTQSAGWFGGAGLVHPRRAPRTPAGYCSHYVKGSNFYSDFGRAVKWSAGFDLGAAFDIKGVNLTASFSSSAQTGYDTNAFMYIHFGHKGWLCGTNGPPSTAAILVQRATRS